MPKFSQLVPLTTDTVTVAGEAVTVTFDKRHDNPEFIDSIRPALERSLGDFWVEYLSTVVVSWDVWDDDGNPWPTDPDSLRKLNHDLLHTIGRWIRDHDLGKGSSPNGSHPTASTDGAQTGTPALSPVGTPAGT